MMLTAINGFGFD